MRRLRSNGYIRGLLSEVSLSCDDFIYPIFVREGIKKKKPIKGLPGQFHYSLNDLDEILERCESLKIPAVLLFGVPKRKDSAGSSAYDKNGIVQRAIRQIKESSNLPVFSDVCLCQYTSHGHCGLLSDGAIDNDKTLDLLARAALSHARAGANFVCPSAMMDGQVASIREALDSNSLKDTGIMSYSAKFASSFYSPFREAVLSSLKGDRSTYQLDFHSGSQALKEIELDIKEGADIVMVKPALPYLDIISQASKNFDTPLAAYQVSGEYALLKSGILDKQALYESLIAIKRAGANIIISYGAIEVMEGLDDYRH
ncbi:MAG: porphobilinogen synthase [Candidatus Altiarchaeales archaeon]|nr:porphobilinogen synthase [Candidatus Altiarchaeales archaeon]